MNEREHHVQDYLDDRMTPDERRAFEDLLARDPDLDAEVDDVRALGDTLRTLDAPLPDGFHDRARARFVASVSPRRRFPFEALGLAAAALVLGAVLVPWAMRTEFGETERAVEHRTAEPTNAPAPAESVESELDAGIENVAADAGSADSTLEESADFAPTPPPAPTAPRDAVAKKAAAPGAMAKEKDARTDRFAAANEGFADATDDEDAGGREQRDVVTLQDATVSEEPRRQRVAAPAARGAVLERAAPIAVPLTVAHLHDTGATATVAGRVPDATTWNRWISEPGGQVLTYLFPDGDWTSVAVVAGPADCRRVRVVSNAPEGVIVVVPEGSDAGCAVRVDGPGNAVRIVREPPP